jgi:hypothetical protein
MEEKTRRKYLLIFIYMVYKKRTHKKFIKNTHKKFIKNTHKKLKNTKKIYGGEYCIKYNTEGIGLETLIDFINKDVGENKPVIYGGKIPDEHFFFDSEGKIRFKKEEFDSFVLNLLHENLLDKESKPIITLKEERETSSKDIKDNARDWHREFYFPNTMFSTTWNNSWVCIAYLKLENCINNCGTEILYYNNKDECKNINLQVSVNDFILFRDCKMIHRMPVSTFEDEHKPIVRNLYRIYIKTGGHENCDPRLIKLTKNIDVEEGRRKEEPVQAIDYTPTGFRPLEP